MIQTTKKQKIWRGVFWGLLIYTACTTTVAIGVQLQLIPVPTRQLSKENPVSTQGQNIELGEVAFAKQFAREYLSWYQGGEESRAIRLKPFWSENLDVQGGMDFSKMQWDSYPQDVEVWKVTNRPGGEGIKEIIVYAETELVDSKRDDQRKRVDRYLQIPIKRAGESYRVVDKPIFVAPPIAKGITWKKEEQEDSSEAVTSDIEKRVNDFLNSFWKKYTEDSPREISYLMKSSSTMAGLTGIMKFHELQNLKVVKLGESYRADCDVLLEDLASGVQMTSHYQLTLIEENSQWFVTELKSGEVK